MQIMLRISLLGSLRLAVDQAAAPVPRLATQKATSLLAYLVTRRGREHPRESLAELFWPDRPATNARRSLHTALWHIRRALQQAGLDPDDFLTAGELAIAWHAPPARFWLDVDEFEACSAAAEPAALQHAVDLYRGGFLDGHYDDWCVQERERLEVRLLDTLARLADAALAEARFAEALLHARHSLQIDPLREDAQRAAMFALYQLGQRAAALDQFAACRERLQAELGIEPSAETRALQRAIVDETLPRRPARGGASVAPAGAWPGATTYDPQRIPLAGRVDERRRLDDWWQQRHESLALLVGEAGVGKTRLAEEWTSALRARGVPVRSGRCYAFERAVPYQAISELLREWLALVPDATLAAWPGWVTAQLARLLPELGERLAGPAEGPRAGASQEPAQELGQALGQELGQELGQGRLFDAVARVLAQLAASEPSLLVVDDLHWAAESTLALLEYLVHRSPLRQSLRWLVTARQEELPGGPAQALLERLQRDRLVYALPLARLGAATVAEWIGAWSGLGERASAFAARLYRETEGNPFFLTKTVESLFESGELRDEGQGWTGAALAGQAAGELPFPHTARELIRVRLRRLPARSAAVLRVAAVLGREFDADVLRAAWAGAEADLLNALDDGLRSQLIRENDAPGARDYEFSHVKIQETVYHDLSRAKRAALHRRVGTALEGEYGDAAAATLQHHYSQAGELARAVRWGVVAGERALALSAYADARRHFEQAREQFERLAPGAVSLECRLALVAGLCRVYKFWRLPARLVPAAEELLALAETAGEPARQVEALLQLGHGLGMANDTRALATLERAHALAAAVESPLLPEIVYRMGTYVGWQGDWTRALGYFDAALAACDRFGDQRMPVRVLIGLGVGRMFTSDLGGSIAAYQRALAEAETLGEQENAAIALNNLADDYLLLRLPGRAREPLRRAQEIYTAIGVQNLDLQRLGGVLLHQTGELAQARAALERTLALARAAHNADDERELCHDVCAVLLDLGEREPALQLAEAFRSNPALHYGDDDWLPAYTRGIVWLALGRLSEAEAELSRAAQKAERLRNTPRLWQVYAALGRLHALQGEPEAAEAACARARTLVQAIAGSLERLPDVRQEFLSAALALVDAARPSGSRAPG
jgi:DNA-binding SARP family transcriptional activator